MKGDFGLCCNTLSRAHADHRRRNGHASDRAHDLRRAMGERCSTEEVHRRTARAWIRPRLYRGQRAGTLAKGLNRIQAAINSAGISRSRFATLEVRGRKSGRVIAFPVVIADYKGERYLRLERCARTRAFPLRHGDALRPNHQIASLWCVGLLSSCCSPTRGRNAGRKSVLGCNLGGTGSVGPPAASDGPFRTFLPVPTTGAVV
jgi:hypothetical protein